MAAPRGANISVGEGGAVQAAEYNFMGLRVCVGNVALVRVCGRRAVKKGKGGDIAVAALLRAFVKINRSSVKAGGCARFKSSYVKAELYKAFCQSVCGRKAARPAFLTVLARDSFRIKINARRYYRGAAFYNSAVGGFNAANCSVLGEYFGAFPLQYAQVLRVFKGALHFAVVCVFVALTA